jgi:signal transduction histidine kinase
MTSIRRHLSILLCLVIGALFVATGAGVFVAMRELLGRQFDETLTAKARAIITASEIDDGEFEIDLTVQDFAGFGGGGKDYFEIRRLNGDLFLCSPSLDAHPNGIWQLSGKLRPPGDDPRIESHALTDGRSAKFYVQRFYPKDDSENEHQDLYLIVASPDGGMRAQLAGLAMVLGIASISALMLMLPAIRFGLICGLKPLDRLSSEFVEIRPENLRQRLDPAAYPEELSMVAERLNEWIARIETSFERERRFGANAAHELRTPLAEIRMMVELGATWPEEATSERCREILTVTGEMETLLERLSLISRAESGRHELVYRHLDTEKAFEQVLARLADKAKARGISIEMGAVADGVGTDPVLWKAILQNLLANAVAHAPSNSAIKVEVDERLISVSNPAPGLSAVELDRMFEPFWRGDPARTSDGHAGLGLSIVKTCAELLGGTCFRELRDGVVTVGVRWE